MRFAGCRPGFLDGSRMVAAAVEEQDTADNPHLLLDDGALQPPAEFDYPRTGCPARPRRDGSWLTLHSDALHRWQLMR
ncbi:hypothetical protein [Streptomyces chilikensis]|uniref:hypothetical protein n=1 Tax=Streptomyces chilikensis TaxID=1194079 RepID=UPI00140D0E33|nr:hypothetical protein [Streptomyces chilikensis]